MQGTEAKENLAINTPPIVSQQEWEAARKVLLVKEKALMHARDAMAAERPIAQWPRMQAGYSDDLGAGDH
jgi:predicted dithiol-disulfide oxidoreductase (DUF899 family)